MPPPEFKPRPAHAIAASAIVLRDKLIAEDAAYQARVKYAEGAVCGLVDALNASMKFHRLRKRIGWFKHVYSISPDTFPATFEKKVCCGITRLRVHFGSDSAYFNVHADARNDHDENDFATSVAWELETIASCAARYAAAQVKGINALRSIVKGNCDC